jgi:hypothetical protein
VFLSLSSTLDGSLSFTENVTVDCALSALVPVPTAPGISAGAATNTAWHTSFTGGIRRDGCTSSDSFEFWPLYSIKKIKEMKRSAGAARGPEAIMSQWFDPGAPWGDLDEEGEEISMEDEYRYQVGDSLGSEAD